ncbi:ricin B-like lectin EULS3 [Rhododendron vialii]|uniref:ricin B-like lectin EULS3 n=1 Tax=Rhododendron vialii TaxID=182163 RepID=UPI00265F0675|nr:ricin B-like lectin EULS3 [Rhododendron vialii]
MEGYSFGHHNTHHHHHEHHNPRYGEEYPPPPPPPSFRDDGPPPPSYYEDYDPPQPPQVNPHHPVYHSRSRGGGLYDSPRSHIFILNHHHHRTSIIRRRVKVTLPNNLQIGLSILRWSIMYMLNRKGITPIGYRLHLPSFLHHHEHQQGSASGKPTVRVFTKSETNYSLTIRDGKVILAPSDRFQHWIKDEKYSTKVKDEEGFPSFALVNKATGQAMKHSVGATHPVCSCFTYLLHIHFLSCNSENFFLF